VTVHASAFDESVAEQALLEWLAELGYAVAHGPDLAPGERPDHREVLLEGRLRDALARLNPKLPPAALDEAVRQVRRVTSPSLVVRNRRFHDLLVDGVEVEVPRAGGGVQGVRVRLVAFDDVGLNDWLAVNQLTVREGSAHRRADVVVYVNGLPLALVELKNPADENADVWSAYKQLQTYKQQLPTLLSYNELLVISDGVDARLGTLTSPAEWFLPWRTIDGADLAPADANRLEVLARGVFEHERLLDLVRHFVVFHDESKVVAAYHQFHATRKAVATTLAAAAPEADGRGGVVWHTQGSGKSLTMTFFAGKLVVEPALANPTLVVITDRNDLDDQLFGVFSLSRSLLRQKPVQARDRAHLRDLLDVAAGGVVFTTIQKFMPDEKGDRHPLLSERSNVVVIADEAHRSQYGFVRGFAAHLRDALPHATFVGFTGTPVELDDRDTRLVFGDYVDVYDIRRAVEDGATVPIYYESRLAKLDLDERERPTIDADFEEVTEGEEEARREKLKTKWGQLEAIVGTEKRLALVARDLVEHFENRLAAVEGKAMVVCMSRRICADLYAELVKLRPEWHADADDAGAVKVVMTGSASDPAPWQPHIRSKGGREALARRFKDPDDPLKIVLVRDMWLTGFDAPSLHTMYVDKPMHGHSLMQAIARVNRVFRDKQGGLVVDYIGIADDLRRALADYARGGGRGSVAIDQGEAVAVLLEKIDVCRTIFHGFDYSSFFTGTATERMALLPAAQEHVLSRPDGKERFVQAVAEVSKAYSLAVPRDEALALRDEVAFFQAVKAALVKIVRSLHRPADELDHAIRQIVAQLDGEVSLRGGRGPPRGNHPRESRCRAFGSPAAAKTSDHLARRDRPGQKLLGDEIRTRARKNVVQARAFSDLLEAAVRRYQARAIEAAQVIEELIALAKDIRAAGRRGEELGLNEDELAFYDALAANESAREVLGDELLRVIARELVDVVRQNVAIDWTVRENVRAHLRVLVKRVLRRHGYPPDKQESATQLVLEQAAVLGLEALEEPPAAEILPFRRLDADEAVPFENCVPLYDLAAAAGGFGEGRAVEPEAWVEPLGRTRPARGLFVARVVGESMNRRIPNGSYCMWRAPVEGGRSGRVVLVESRAISDPDTGGSYTVKRYERMGPDRVQLVPETDALGYEALELTAAAAEAVRVVAELVEVLG
jgi:type I restriction enzyme R subunit